MIDSNQQVMHRAFDSMVMHLRHLHEKSWPKDMALLKGEPKGQPASAPPARPSFEWQRLADDLHRIGLDKRLSDAWVSWASSRETPSQPRRIRLLHPMERELIALDAFNDLLELSRLGVLTAAQLENVLDNCAYLPSLPAGREQVRTLALRVFAEQFQSQGYGPSH